MNFLRVVWDLDDDTDGNVQHIAEHGISPDEVEEVLFSAPLDAYSRSSGRPMVFGFTEAGRMLIVIFEFIDEDTIYPVTAYDGEEE